MSIETLTSGTLTVPCVPMTMPILDCPPPVLEADFQNCRVPGGLSFWSANGFYSPGICFQGYQAECTQTDVRGDAWPIDDGETAVMCIPTGYGCNEADGNPRFATTEYDGTTLSAPAFEIRWRSEDLETGDGDVAWPTMATWETSKATSSPTLTAPDVKVTALATKSPRPSDSLVSPAQSNKEASTSLTGESIAGIAVGASFGAFLSALALIYLAMRCRRHQKSSASSSTDSCSQNQRLPSYAVSPNQPAVELHHESVGPRELESEPVSPTSKGPPVSPISPYREMDRRIASLNSVPFEMEGDERFARRSTGVQRTEEAADKAERCGGACNDCPRLGDL